MNLKKTKRKGLSINLEGPFCLMSYFIYELIQ